MLRLIALALSTGLIVMAAGRPANSTPSGERQSYRPWLEFEGKRGPGRGKTIVLISGDEEYRSEETMPQFARILSERHGFRTIVLFAIDPKDGTINPNVNNNIPGLDNLKKADLVVMLLRWRNL